MTTTRNTVQRRDVIEVLSHAEGSVSARDLHAIILKNGGHISLATVYTQLKRMVESGDVDVMMSNRREGLYRSCAIGAGRHHLTCRQCGAMVEFDAPEIESSAHVIGERYSYNGLRLVLELNGVCASCQSR